MQKRCMVCGKTYKEDICPLCGVSGDLAENLQFQNKAVFETFFSVVIIGGGLSGIETALRIRQLNKFCNITVISRTTPYNKIKLLSSKSYINEFNLVSISKLDFESLKIEFIKDEVLEINRFEKMVKLGGGTYVCYDKLVIATGENFPVKETPLITIVPYNNKQNYETISRHMVYNNSVVVYGSGLRALSAVNLLVSSGAEVTVICPEDGFLSGILTDDLCSEIKNAVNSKTKFLGNTDIEQICLNSLKLTNGDVISAPFVIDASYGKPEITLAENSGIICTDKIKVSEYMQTNDSSVFALGMATGTFEYRNILRQSQAIAYKIFGVNKAYTPKQSVLKIDCLENTYYTYGNIKGCDEVLIKKNLPLKTEKRLFVKDSIVKGILFKNESCGFMKSASKISKPVDFSI